VTSATGAVATRMAEFVTGPVTAPIDVRRAAVRHILDAIGCGLAAVGTGAGGAPTAIAEAAGGAPEASVIGATSAFPAAAAAFANGSRMHALDFDDTHEAGICHVTSVVAPAAMAVAEARGAPGADAIDAYLVGSEIALRIAIAVAPGLYARGFHPTSVCGAFGAAAAAARLQGSSAPQVAHAIGIVGSFASGLFEYLSDGSATKPLHAGWAAHAGVQAAALAQQGATGPSTVIEGRFGLLRSHADEWADPSSILDALGERWEAAHVAIKPYPACHFAHAATWAVGRLSAEHNLDAQAIACVDVRVAEEGVALVLEPIERKQRPATPYDAKFSIPFMVAHQLLYGRLDLESFSDDRIRDRAVLDLASRVTGEAWRDGMPPSRFAAQVWITTRDGHALSLEVRHTPGSPQNPLSDQELRDKFNRNASLALDGAQVQECYDKLTALDVPQPAGRALELLRSAVPRPASDRRPRAASIAPASRSRSDG
jgi:2-methylcitrate dehydratase PrpD